MSKILITGAAGFIFSRFAKYCVEAGDEVVVIDALTYAGDMARLASIENKIKFYHADITNAQAVNEIFQNEKPNIIVHGAAESHVDRSILDASPFIDANVKGTQVVLDAARRIDIEKFINIATDEVYGELGESGSFYETTPLNPNSPYSVSKTAADMLGNAYFRTYQMPVVTLRPSNNYGPFQYPEKLIPVVFLKAFHNEKIPVYGKGLNVREWLFVDDAAAAVYAIVKKGKAGEIYNIGSGEEKQNIFVVNAILDLMGKPNNLIEYVKDRPGHDFRYSLNCDKMKAATGWKIDYNFEKGIEATIKWYFDNLNWTNAKLDFLRKYWNEAYVGNK